MRVTKKDLQNYLGCAKSTANKRYQAYLDALNITKRNYLTVFDIAKIDDLKPQYVAKIMGFDDGLVQKILILNKYG